VWSKRLTAANKAIGRRAVLLLNRSEAEAPVAVDWAELGLGEGKAKVRDLWRHKDVALAANSYKATVPGGDAVLLLIEGAEPAVNAYKAAAQDVMLDASAAVVRCAECAGAKAVALPAGGSIGFMGVKGSSAMATVAIAYRNRGMTPLLAQMRVNTDQPTWVAFPPTAEGRLGAVSVAVTLPNAGGNTISILAGATAVMAAPAAMKRSGPQTIEVPIEVPAGASADGPGQAVALSSAGLTAASVSSAKVLMIDSIAVAADSH
jgi:hypothetical protein